jgi:hypothetical protein
MAEWEPYDAEAHRNQILTEAAEIYAATFEESGAEAAFWARRARLGYMSVGDDSRLGVIRCWAPSVAPFTFWSKFVDLNHPGYVFRVSRVESHFGDTALFDVRGMWHELDDCHVVEYVSPETVEQIAQDNLLKRLEGALGIKPATITGSFPSAEQQIAEWQETDAARFGVYE